MYKHPKAPLAWNVFCDGDGEVIGWFAVEGNTVRINDPSGGTKLAKINLVMAFSHWWRVSSQRRCPRWNALPCLVIF